MYVLVTEMKELIYSDEEKIRLENGLLFYPFFPEDLYRTNDGSLCSKKYPYSISYPYFIRNLFIVDCYISDIKNLIRQLINIGEKEEIIESAFKVLEENLKARDKIKKNILEFEIKQSNLESILINDFFNKGVKDNEYKQIYQR